MDIKLIVINSFDHRKVWYTYHSSGADPLSNKREIMKDHKE